VIPAEGLSGAQIAKDSSLPLFTITLALSFKVKISVIFTVIVVMWTSWFNRWDFYYISDLYVHAVFA